MAGSMSVGVADFGACPPQSASCTGVHAHIALVLRCHDAVEPTRKHEAPGPAAARVCTGTAVAEASLAAPQPGGSFASDAF
jgi:hypothetical protein